MVKCERAHAKQRRRIFIQLFRFCVWITYSFTLTFCSTVKKLKMRNKNNINLCAVTNKQILTTHSLSVSTRRPARPTQRWGQKIRKKEIKKKNRNLGNITIYHSALVCRSKPKFALCTRWFPFRKMKEEKKQNNKKASDQPTSVHANRRRNNCCITNA